MFDPDVALAKMTSDRIIIDEGGFLDIGSSDCPFNGNAEILLTGLVFAYLRRQEALLHLKKKVYIIILFSSRYTK